MSPLTLRQAQGERFSAAPVRGEPASLPFVVSLSNHERHRTLAPPTSKLETVSIQHYHVHEPQGVGFGWSVEQVVASFESAGHAILDARVVFGGMSAGNRIAHLAVQLAEHAGQIDYIRGVVQSQGK